MNIKHITNALVLTLSTTAAFSAELPTAPFRQEHVEIKEHLGHLDTMIGTLPSAPAEARQRTMKQVVKFLDEHIREHAEWEEAHLYPTVDKRTLAGPNPFTASMRYEHRIVGRSIDALAKMANDPNASPVTFARSADRLLGLISAHFEEEEEVLLPILDKSMTKAEFEAELGHVGHTRE
jgi:hemerythrin-like domain-containing protein